MRSNRRLPFRLSALGLSAVLAVAFVVAGCGATNTGGTSPTATTAPTNTVPVPTTTPSNSAGKAAVAVTGAYGTFKFSPNTLSVAAGTTVTWTDDTSVPHTVTSDSGDPDAFNGSLGGNGATFSFTFKTPGTYTYHCSIHPYMTATITVTM